MTDDLGRRMRDLGAPDPDDWTHSETTEDIAQQARWLVLRRLWPDAIDAHTPETVRNVPAARRAVEAGADPADVATAMRNAAYEAVFAVLHRIDEGCDENAPPDAPGWSLREVRFAGDDATLTGRDVGGLHEDLLRADPSGTEGADLWS